ncbi:hypothetical protein Kpol_1023p85 [Vanderwaltozyma polyspora DSM 70294]|uniref:Uncharacterized protein n=1 Tax=Vanderwaltozyma polyspora (strain ATCC 22028 / DSM 70294 / BCRC 21397 / CBS 2163 / NBRC 10782 / NRRL Y-8283 / UCD 57-17) TaxID=436907 RepID=A7TFV6_VANPO|nr:uncharacterized protein Kpol_1023p85 [Vanderwaltozyma polyspora DSM 70294]EDO18914.1 hypothetical protein Kpol_1023p85 [Vanderwaltozyma polyspora DSM 70294]
MNYAEPCSTSNEFTNKNDIKSLPYYFVHLTDKHLSNFETLNAMALIGNYADLLFFIESYETSDTFVVPPYDIIILLLTLVTVSKYYKEATVRKNDYYVLTGKQLNKRSIAILKNYIEILNEFDCGKYDRYSLELLRCQFFLAIELIFNKEKRTDIRNRFKRRRAEVEFEIEYLTSSVDENNDDDTIGFQNPYNSYIPFLDRNKTVLGNKLFNIVLNKRDSFINLLIWTLSNSLEEDTALYLSSQEIWMPILQMILDIYLLRHDYYIQNELTNKGNSHFFSRELSRSPIGTLLRSIGEVDFIERFCESVFINCSDRNDILSYRTVMQRIYQNENVISNAFLPRVKYSNDYKMLKSMSIRRKMIGLCFRLLQDLDDDERLELPKMSTNTLGDSIIRCVINFDNIKQFKMFFYTEMISKELFFLPILAEDCILKLSENYLENNRETLDLCSNFNNSKAFFQILVELINDGYFYIPELKCNDNDAYDKSNNKEKNDENNKIDAKIKKSLYKKYITIMKADICLIVLLRFFIYENSNMNEIKALSSFNNFLARVKKLDSERLNEFGDIGKKEESVALFSRVKLLFCIL